MFDYNVSVSNYNVAEGGYLIPCSSALHGGIICVIRVASPTTVSEISSLKDVLRVKGLSSAISAGQTFTFQTTDSQFKNPPSTKAISTFEAASFAASQNGIDE